MIVQGDAMNAGKPHGKLIVRCWCAYAPGKKETVLGFWKTKAAAQCQSDDVRKVKIAIEQLG